MPTTTTTHKAPAPPVTDYHRHAAFESVRSAWPGLTVEAAMQDSIQRKVVEVRAHTLAAQEAQAHQQRAPQLVRRCHPVTHAWSTQRVAGVWVERTQLEIES